MGDFNGDGKLDLAVGGIAQSTVWILMGNGNDSFTLAATIGTKNVVESVTNSALKNACQFESWTSR